MFTDVMIAAEYVIVISSFLKKQVIITELVFLKYDDASPSIKCDAVVFCVTCCSYNTDNAESIESQCVRLKSCLYHEETASTCSVIDQSSASRTTLSLLQPTKPSRVMSQQSHKHNEVTECHRETLHNSKHKMKTSDTTRPRYCHHLTSSSCVWLHG